jgi:hypothetical protein
MWRASLEELGSMFRFFGFFFFKWSDAIWSQFKMGMPETGFIIYFSGGENIPTLQAMWVVVINPAETSPQTGLWAPHMLALTDYPKRNVRSSKCGLDSGETREQQPPFAYHAWLEADEELEEEIVGFAHRLVSCRFWRSS